MKQPLVGRHSRLKLPLVMGAFLLCALNCATRAATWFVSSAGSAEATGASWFTAHSHPAQAAAQAQAGDEIWVAAGTYSGGPIRLPSGVRLLGGFLGDETFATERSTNAALTVLEATNAAPLIEVLNGETNRVTSIAGFTLQASGLPSANGRGLVALNCRLEVEGCVFRRFKAPTSFQLPGAALCITNGSLSVTRSSFQDNEAVGTDGYAAGIGCVTVSPCVIHQTRFVRNRAGAAAALELNASQAEITECEFAGNEVLINGVPGAVELYASYASVLRNRFLFNRNGAGSALFIFANLERKTNLIAFNVFAGNVARSLAGFNGGVISFYSSARVQIIHNTLAGNLSIAETGRIAACGTHSSDGKAGEIANNLFLANHYGDRLEGFPGAARNVFLDYGEADRVGLEAIGRPEGIVTDEVVGGLAGLDFHLLPTAVSRGYGDPAKVPPGAIDLLGRPVVQADGSVDAGAIAFDPQHTRAGPPKIIHLRPDGDDGAKGDSWMSAVRSLKAAVERTEPTGPTEIWLAQGTYDGLPNQLHLPPGVSLRGSFQGHETNASQRVRPLSLTSELVRRSTNVLLTLTENGPWNEIDGLVLNGAGTYYKSIELGGVVALAAWPHISHCRFENHHGGATGIALLADGGVIEDCQFSGNVRTNGSLGNCGGIVYLRGFAPFNIFRRNRVIGNEDRISRSALCWFGVPAIVEHNLWLGNRTGSNSLGMVFTGVANSVSIGTGHGFYHNTWTDNIDESPNPTLFQLPANANFRLQFLANLVAHNRGEVRLSASLAATTRDNLIFDNGPVPPANPLPVEWNLSVAPRLAPDRGHLLPDSPARNAVKFPRREGFQTDLDGDGAWLGSAPDIGADEFLPDHRLAQTIAGAEVALTPQAEALSGILRDWEDTCPDCYSRSFTRDDGGFRLELAPETLCPDIACSGQLRPVEYPFDFGATVPGVYQLRVAADGVALRTLSLWVRPLARGHLKVREVAGLPVVTQTTHPGVFLSFQGSSNLVDWVNVNTDAQTFIGTRTNENWFFRTLVR